jgi:hypothetical protein
LIDLPSELIRTDQLQQRTDQHLGDHDQQLTRIIVIDQGIKGFKITTEVRRDDPVARTRRSSAMATYPTPAQY